MRYGSRHPLSERLLQNLVVPQGLVIRMEKEVGVTFD
jgi:hypothetical protein